MIPDLERMEAEIAGLQARKDTVMDLSRKIIRLTGKCITLMHGRDMAKAGEMLRQGSDMIKELHASDRGFEYNSQQAYQEYVEAAALHSILTKRRIPSASELEADSVAYLLGLLDLVGELKREAFESLRKNDVKTAEEYYSFMEDIHDSLLPLRFSSSIVSDLRKKQDVARIQLESVAGELLSFGARQRD